MLHCYTAKFCDMRALTSPRCPHCDDWMVAPRASEFVAAGEIRHYWECDSCGATFSSSIPICHDE